MSFPIIQLTRVEVWETNRFYIVHPSHHQRNTVVLLCFTLAEIVTLKRLLPTERCTSERGEYFDI